MCSCLLAWSPWLSPAPLTLLVSFSHQWTCDASSLPSGKRVAILALVPQGVLPRGVLGQACLPLAAQETRQTHQPRCPVSIGSLPAEPSKVTASSSHPDLLGGWDAWAEAAVPTPAPMSAAEGKATWPGLQGTHPASGTGRVRCAYRLRSACSAPGYPCWAPALHASPAFSGMHVLWNTVHTCVLLSAHLVLVLQLYISCIPCCVSSVPWRTG